jgi:hypothetical protein
MYNLTREAKASGNPNPFQARMAKHAKRQRVDLPHVLEVTAYAIGVVETLLEEAENASEARQTLYALSQVVATHIKVQETVELAAQLVTLKAEFAALKASVHGFSPVGSLSDN